MERCSVMESSGKREADEGDGVMNDSPKLASKVRLGFFNSIFSFFWVDYPRTHCPVTDKSPTIRFTRMILTDCCVVLERVC